MNNLNATIYTDTLTAFQVFPRQFIGAMFKIISCTGPVSVKSNGVKLDNLTAGQGFQDIPFDRLEITDASGASNTIRYLIATEGFIDGLTGAMSITSMVPVASSSFAITVPAITGANLQVLAANTARKYLLIQNNDSSVTITVNFGAVAVVGQGVKIGPGGAYEMADVQSTQSINIIGSGVTGNVIVVEG